MISQSKSTIILYADDDAEDRLLAKEAFQETCLANRMHFVEDGEELMDYLQHRGKYKNKDEHPTPGLILLDLNMPRKDGREALREIKSNPKLRLIPIVILTTSAADDDIVRTYELGVNSFITKPVSFSALVDIMRTLNKYWFETVALPNRSQ